MSIAVREVNVSLAERSYSIQIGYDTLAKLGSYLRQLTKFTHAIVITDANVAEHYAEIVTQNLAATESENQIEVDLLVVEPGEQTKSIEAATEMWNKFPLLGADRKSLVIALGGGVVGDLAGFIAATYTRGMAFVQIPTSLLAQVDSSVGGKVGINLPSAKNMVGAFWQPLGVLIDIKTLQTLSQREYSAGLAEVIKYGAIMDEPFFEYLEAHIKQINQRDPETLIEIVARCCQLKAQVVEEDEQDLTGRRAILNFGHTFAHAIEKVAGYGEVLHGEAVSIGMICAARLAEKMGRIDATMKNRLWALLTQVGLPVEVPELSIDKLLAAMQSDKKVEYGKLRFVLPTKLGHVEMVDQVQLVDVEEAWQN